MTGGVTAQATGTFMGVRETERQGARFLGGEEEEETKEEEDGGRKKEFWA